MTPNELIRELTRLDRGQNKDIILVVRDKNGKEIPCNPHLGITDDGPNYEVILSIDLDD